MANFRFVLHPGLKKQIDELTSIDKSFEKQFLTAIRKLQANPYKSPAKALKYAPPKLQGIIWRIWVGGRKDYRLFYAILREKGIIGLITLYRKSEIGNYKHINWSKLSKLISEIDES